jgi:hypothetical protein
MTDQPLPRGELAREKLGSVEDPGVPQPEAAEVESARQLENEAAPQLEADGASRDQVRRLADEYVALDLGEDAQAFVGWARRRLNV